MEFFLISKALLFPAYRNKSLKPLSLPLKLRSACAPGTHETQRRTFPCLPTHPTHLLEFGNSTWVTFSTCCRSPWGLTPHHWFQTGWKTEQGRIETEEGMWCAPHSFCPRGPRTAGGKNFLNLQAWMSRILRTTFIFTSLCTEVHWKLNQG